MQLLSSLSFLLPLLAVQGVSAALDPSTVDAHVSAAAALLGSFTTTTDATASWMGALDDTTTLQSMSIPGSHDSLAWNVSGIASAFTKTQDIPLFKQLDSGIRFIDLRVGDNNGMVQLYHGSVLLDQTAQLADVFYGLYKWLDAHATETLIVSVKLDNGNSTTALEQTIHDLVTGQDVADYWVQGTTFPTLGAARHKAVLLRRFAFEQSPNLGPLGIDASSGWTNNNAAFSILYSTGGDTLFIEDLYDVSATAIPAAVDAKFAAVQSGIDAATSSANPNQMYITFASGSAGIAVTPSALAQGNGTTTPGVNTKTIGYLAEKKGGRFGVVLFDFVGSDSRIVPATLSQTVDLAATPSSQVTSSAVPTTTRRTSAATSVRSDDHGVRLVVAFASVGLAALMSVAFVY